MSNRNSVFLFVAAGGLAVFAVSFYQVVASDTTTRGRTDEAAGVDEKESGPRRADHQSPRRRQAGPVSHHRAGPVSHVQETEEVEQTPAKQWASEIDRAIESGDLEEVQRLEFAAWNDKLERHEAEPHNSSFADRVEPDVEGKLRAMTVDGVRFEGVACRSTTCRGRFSFDDFNAATQGWESILANPSYGYDQLRVSMTLPTPEDPNAPYEASVILDFSNVDL